MVQIITPTAAIKPIPLYGTIPPSSLKTLYSYEGAPIYSYDIYNYTMVDRSAAIPNGISIKQMAVYFGNTTAFSGSLLVVRKDSAGWYTMIGREALSGHTPVVGWDWITLSAPIVVPSSGTHYIGLYSLS